MRYDFFVTVWGSAFVDKFLRYSLASQLSQENIPALAKEAGITYWVYTDRVSEAQLAEAGKLLGGHVDFRLVFFEDLPYGGGRLSDAMDNSDPAVIKHNVQRVTAIHLMAEAARHEDTAVLLLDSDFIFSNGSLMEVHRQRMAGARSFAAMFMRLSQEGAAPELDEAFKEAGGKGLDGPGLVRIGLSHAHPITWGFSFDGDQFSAYPTQINWAVKESGFVAHCFFPHPLMVTPGGAPYFSTMDYEVLLRSAEDEAIHLARSSDDFLVCKMTHDAYLEGELRTGERTVERLARFAIDNTNLRHRLFMAQPIRFSAGGAEEAWAEAERQSTNFVEAVYKGVELLLASITPGDAKSLVYVKSFLGPIEDYLSPQQHARMKGWIPPSKPPPG